MTAYARAWHLFIGPDGTLTAAGGRTLTVGVTRDGGVHLDGDAIGPEGTALAPAAALRLGNVLDDAAEAAREFAPGGIAPGALTGRLSIGVTAGGIVHLDGEFAGVPFGATLAGHLGGIITGYALRSGK